MSERWDFIKLSDHHYAFKVKQRGMPIMAWVMGAVMFWSVILPIFIIAMQYLRSRPYEFEVGSEGFVAGGKRYPLDRINELEIRNPRGDVISSGPKIGFVGAGAGGYALAGAAAAGSSLMSGMDSGMIANGYQLSIQVGSRHIPLAKNLKEVDARGLFADVMRALEGRL